MLETAAEGPVTGEEPPRRKGRRWRPLVLLPVLALAAGLCLVWYNRVALMVRMDPIGALERGVQRVKPLPQPLSLGFLGEVSQGEETAQCSGVAELSADEQGLKIYWKDCTLGNGEGSVTASVYLSPAVAAVSAPQLTGTEIWYGVSLETPLAEQAAGTGGDPEWGWYFDSEKLRQAQAAADLVRESLSRVGRLGLETEEREALKGYLEGAFQGAERTGTGYLLVFSQPETGETEELTGALGVVPGLLEGPVEVRARLDRAGVLAGIEVDSGNLSFTLDLGDDPAHEPFPRLEAGWQAAGEERGLTLAFTLDQAGAMRPPVYRNAFSLLPRG